MSKQKTIRIPAKDAWFVLERLINIEVALVKYNPDQIKMCQELIERNKKDAVNAKEKLEEYYYQE